LAWAGPAAEMKPAARPATSAGPRHVLARGIAVLLIRGGSRAGSGSGAAAAQVRRDRSWSPMTRGASARQLPAAEGHERVPREAGPAQVLIEEIEAALHRHPHAGTAGRLEELERVGPPLEEDAGVLRAALGQGD